MLAFSCDAGRGARHAHEMGKRGCGHGTRLRTDFAASRLQFAHWVDIQVLQCKQGELKTVVDADFVKEPGKIDLDG